MSADPSDELLPPHRLDLATMKYHHFVTADSNAGNIVYRVLFTDGDERMVPLPQPSLFSVFRGPWSRTKEELDGKLSLLGFYGYNPENQVPSDHTMPYTGASSSTYQVEGTSSSRYEGIKP
jgi:hypothetical protein